MDISMTDLAKSRNHGARLRFAGKAAAAGFALLCVTAPALGCTASQGSPSSAESDQSRTASLTASETSRLAAFDPYAFVAGTVPDEAQLQVAKELGIDAEALDAMMAGGMGEDEYALVVPAADLVQRVESRYGIDVAADWLGSGEHWTLEFTPAAGGHAGEPFTAESIVNDEGEVEYYDDYYGAYRAEDYQEFAEGVVARSAEATGLDCGVAVLAAIGKMVNQDVPLDAPLVGAGQDFHGFCNVVLYGPGCPGEGAHTEAIDKLAEKLASGGARFSLHVFCYPDATDEAAAIEAFASGEPSWVETRIL